MTERNIIATHEAGHAVIARMLGVEIVHSTAAGDVPCTRTRYRGDTPQTLAKLGIVDLAGPMAEWHYLRSAWCTDLENAMGRARRIAALNGEEATELLHQMRIEALALVQENWPAIERVADALAHAKSLTQADVDVLIGRAC
jgi:hypothetical protein